MTATLLLALLVASLLFLCAKRRSRRAGEAPLIQGWIPYLGKALDFGKDARAFLTGQQRKHGDVFTVKIAGWYFEPRPLVVDAVLTHGAFRPAGKFMTFVMNPLLYPHIPRHRRHLDIHKLSNQVASAIFGYPSLLSGQFPGMFDQLDRLYKILQGHDSTTLTESMMGKIMLVLRHDHLGKETLKDSGWIRGGLYDFCNSLMFDASVLTFYGLPQSTSRHSELKVLREDFAKFDSVFPQLAAGFPWWLLGDTKAIRRKITNYFLPQRMASWTDVSEFIRRRSEIFDQYESLKDFDKAGCHFTILWATVANSIPASFWAIYYLMSNPQAMEVIHQEIVQVLGLREDLINSDLTLSRQQLENLVYLNSAILESLRLSSSSINFRVAEEDFVMQLGNEQSVAVRKGDIVTLFPMVMHMDPEIYEDPETFRYDRFVQDGKPKTDFYKNGQKLKTHLMPFGFGAFMCPGRFFAINEIKQLVCLLLLNFELQLDEGQARPSLQTSRAGFGILPPSTDVRFRYRLRRVPSGPETQA